jgi:DUF971 family protein
MTIDPTQIKRISSNELEITWQDGLRAVVSSKKLRQHCPCASCKELRGDTTHATPLTGKKSLLKVVEHTSDESTSLTELWAIGRYAVGCRFADGHDTGIYPYALLRELSCP